jgi:cobalt/nickel transport system ATP-binding protein
MSDPLIWLDQVHFQYAPDRAVLSDCSLRVHAGDRIGLTGAVGSGKTSLLRLVVGLVRPTAGRVEVFGRTRTRESDFHEVRRRIGFLFQDADDQLFCPTVAEDVAFGPLNLGLPRDEVRQLVTQTLAE